MFKKVDSSVLKNNDILSLNYTAPVGVLDNRMVLNKQPSVSSSDKDNLSVCEAASFIIYFNSIEETSLIKTIVQDYLFEVTFYTFEVRSSFDDFNRWAKLKFKIPVDSSYPKHKANEYVNYVAEKLTNLVGGICKDFSFDEILFSEPESAKCYFERRLSGEADFERIEQELENYNELVSEIEEKKYSSAIITQEQNDKVYLKYKPGDILRVKNKRNLFSFKTVKVLNVLIDNKGIHYGVSSVNDESINYYEENELKKAFSFIWD